MAMTGAEKQAGYRRRQKQKMLELIQEVEKLRAMVGRKKPARSGMTVPDPTTEAGYREIVARRAPLND